MAYEIIYLERNELNNDNVNRIQNNVSLSFQEVLFEIEELKKRIKTLEGANNGNT